MTKKLVSSNPVTQFCFFDETGLLNSRRDKFFGVGMIKIHMPENLYLKMKKLRDSLRFYDEIKWNGIYTKNAPVMIDFIDLFFEYGRARFSCYIFKKSDLEIKKHFGGNLYSAYESLATMQVCANLNKDESAILIMDDLSTPSDKFEQNIKRKVNSQLQRNAAYGVMRVYSKGSELIQLADLMLGAVCYDFKRNADLIPGPGLAKTSVLEYLMQRVGVETFTNDYSSATFRVWTFKK